MFGQTFGSTLLSGLLAIALPGWAPLAIAASLAALALLSWRPGSGEAVRRLAVRVVIAMWTLSAACLRALPAALLSPVVP